MESMPSKLDSKEQPMSSAKVRVHGDIADKMTVGEPAMMKVTGKVKSLTPCEDFADHYDVEIMEPHVEHIDENGQDENLAAMPKENLKKLIVKKETY